MVGLASSRIGFLYIRRVRKRILDSNQIPEHLTTVVPDTIGDTTLTFDFKKDERATAVIGNKVPAGYQRVESDRVVPVKGVQLAALNSLDSSPLKKKYVLGVYKANALTANHKQAEAIDGLRRAITANPKLAGAYVTLGGYYYRRYKMPIAFELWDRAESIAPNHEALKTVANLKEKLQHDYPDFF